MLSKILSHPLTRNLDPDDPKTTELRKEIIKSKGFLYKLYVEWYKKLASALPSAEVCPGKVLELGSGGGFFKEILPDCITSEVFATPGVDRVLDARAMPFEAEELRGIVMVDVLHHIPEVERFFAEAERVLRPGGVIAMLEPWNTAWSRFIYSNLHPEPFEPAAPDWSFPSSGPLSGANGALPWIIFQRDRERFTQNFPSLRLERLEADYPFSYLASGGVSMRSLAPGFCFGPLRFFERLCAPLRGKLAMFAFIVIKKV